MPAPVTLFGSTRPRSRSRGWKTPRIADLPVGRPCMKCVHWPIILAVSLALTGCETTRYVPGKPLTGDPYIDGQNAILYGPPKDKVLWQYRTAEVAMRRGQFAEAKQLLDDALARIGN